MRKLLLAATAALTFAVPAAAATTTIYNFSLTGIYPATWSMPATPTPDAMVPDILSTFEGITFTFPDTSTRDYDFYVWGNSFGGGISISGPSGGIYRGRGDEIFTGSLAAPTFKTGTFTLTNFGNVQNGSLTISAPVGGVPEPASWAMLIAGFGLTGAAMRRRRTGVAAA